MDAEGVLRRGVCGRSPNSTSNQIIAKRRRGINTDERAGVRTSEPKREERRRDPREARARRAESLPVQRLHQSDSPIQIPDCREGDREERIFQPGTGSTSKAVRRRMGVVAFASDRFRSSGRLVSRRCSFRRLPKVREPTIRDRVQIESVSRKNHVGLRLVDDGSNDI